MYVNITYWNLSLILKYIEAELSIPIFLLKITLNLILHLRLLLILMIKFLELKNKPLNKNSKLIYK